MVHVTIETTKNSTETYNRERTLNLRPQLPGMQSMRLGPSLTVRKVVCAWCHRGSKFGKSVRIMVVHVHVYTAMQVIGR